MLWLNTPALLEPATAKTEEGYEHTFARAVWSLCLVLAPVLPQSLAEQARIVITCGPGGDLSRSAAPERAAAHGAGVSFRFCAAMRSAVRSRTLRRQ